MATFVYGGALNVSTWDNIWIARSSATKILAFVSTAVELAVMGRNLVRPASCLVRSSVSIVNALISAGSLASLVPNVADGNANTRRNVVSFHAPFHATENPAKSDAGNG